MRPTAITLLVILLGGLALPFYLSAEEAADGWRTSIVALLDGKNITGEEFGKYLVLLGYQDDRDRLINLEIVRQEKTTAGITVAPEEIDKAYKEYIAELLEKGEGTNEEALLYIHRMTLDDVRDSIMLRIALKKMVMRDLKVSEENVTNAIPLWFEKKKAVTRILRFSMKNDQPFEHCAQVNDTTIPVSLLISEILKRKSDAEIDDFLQELLDYFALQRYLDSVGKKVTKEDLMDEFEKLRDEVAEDPQFNGIGLIALLAAQKKTIDDLMSEPGFLLRAFVRKAIDSDKDFTAEEQRDHYKQNVLEFCDREIQIRIISLYYKETDGTPRQGVTRESVVSRTADLRKQLVEGASFETLAEQNAEDPGLKKSKGLVGTPLTQSSTIFQFLPQLLVIFDAAEGSIVGPIETDYGSHIVKIEKLTDKPFEEVQGLVLTAMRRDYRRQRLVELRERYKTTSIGAQGILKLFKPTMKIIIAQ